MYCITTFVRDIAAATTEIAACPDMPAPKLLVQVGKLLQ